MIWGILAIILATFVVIFVLIRDKLPGKKVAQGQYLQKMAAYLEGKLVKDEERQDTSRVLFQFRNRYFEFEDTQKKGFSASVDAAYLRTKTQSNLNLTFSEREKAQGVKSEVFIASQVPDDCSQLTAKVKLPQALQDFNVYTNDPVQVNALWEDRNVVDVFKGFKNSDARGHPFLSLSIRQGTVVLEFYSVISFKPSLLELRDNVPSLEKYLDRIAIVADRLDRVHQNSDN